MRRALSLFFVFVAIFVFSSACSQKKKIDELDFEVYFPNLSAVAFSGDSFLIETKKVREGEMEQADYSSVTFSGDAEWIYGLTVESFSFTVVANRNVSLDFLIEFINVETGTETVSGTKRVRKTAVIILTTQKEKTVSVEVFDKFPNKSGSIKITIYDATPFVEDSDLKWKIVDFSIKAKH